MDRIIDLERVGMVMDNLSEVEYSVAKKNNEDLWNVYRSMRDRILFLENCGIVSEKEREGMLKWAENEYSANGGAIEAIPATDEEFCDVGF